MDNKKTLMVVRGEDMATAEKTASRLAQIDGCLLYTSAPPLDEGFDWSAPCGHGSRLRHADCPIVAGRLLSNVPRHLLSIIHPRGGDTRHVCVWALPKSEQTESKHISSTIPFYKSFANGRRIDPL